MLCPDRHGGRGIGCRQAQQCARKGYLAAYKELSETCGIENDIKVSDLARVNDIFTVSKEPEDEEKICADVLSVAAEALERFIAMRAVEGGKLKDDVTSRLDFIIDKVAFIEERSPQTVKEYNESYSRECARFSAMSMWTSSAC